MMRIGGTQLSLKSVKSSQVYAAGSLIRVQNYCLGIVHCGFWLSLLDTYFIPVDHSFSKKTVSLCS